MPLIVEDGSGVVDANSYATVAEAEDYFQLKGQTVTISEADLINATQYLDVTYGMNYMGRIAASDQSLLWPRTAFFDQYGRRRDANAIPKELKTATYEAALLATTGTLFAAPSPDNNVQSLSNSVDGAVSESRSFFGPTLSQEDAERSRIWNYLAPILNFGGLGGVNGVRVK